jgi:hypothetical protein
MSNSRTQSINYTPRYTQWEAFDLLPPLIRAALREGPQEWDTAALLRMYRREIKAGATPEKAERGVAQLVWNWHIGDIHEAALWQDKRKPGQKKVWKPSPHLAAKATMMFNPENALPAK